MVLGASTVMLPKPFPSLFSTNYLRCSIFFSLPSKIVNSECKNIKVKRAFRKGTTKEWNQYYHSNRIHFYDKHTPDEYDIEYSTVWVIILIQYYMFGVCDEIISDFLIKCFIVTLSQ